VTSPTFSPPTQSSRVSNDNWRGWAAGSLLAVAAILSWYIVSFYQTAFYPHTTINGVNVGDLSTAKAIAVLEAAKPTPAAFSLVLATETTFLASSSAELQADYAYEQAVPQFFATAHQGNWWLQLKRLAGLSHESYTMPISVSTEKVTTLVADLAKQVDQPEHKPSVALKQSGIISSLVVDPGKNSQKIDQAVTAQLIHDQLQTFTPLTESPEQKLTVTAAVATTSTALSPEEITQVTAAAKPLVGKALSLTLPDQTFVWDDRILVSLLTLPHGTNATAIDQKLVELQKEIPNQPINAEFTYDPTTLQVQTFNPGRDGLTLGAAETKTAVVDALARWQNQTEKTATQTIYPKTSNKPPEIPLSSTNSLGIAERIGFGESFYAHSIPTRVHNVALTAKRINLTIVKPGEEFSFNKTLGEVSAKTGFQPAYVIKSGRTELGDGGGVCQVSSTLFRSVMNAGLNITKRLPHSYRVTYYELNSQAGFDATVYDGNVDFRFKNDTPGHLLIYTETDSKKLWMKVEIYGTSDGRTATISDYKAWGATPALPTEYIPDASLPTGKKKQVDWPAAGLKTSFVYTVKDASGNTKQQETYTSNYRPWAAKYLVGI
jgi:vancomycin resistance protein YoaR